MGLGVRLGLGLGLGLRYRVRVRARARVRVRVRVKGVLTCTMPRVAEHTGSEKSPPGGDTAPTMETEPMRSGLPRILHLPLYKGEDVGRDVGRSRG